MKKAEKKSKSQGIKNRKKIILLTAAIAGVLILMALPIIIYYLYFWQKVYYGIEFFGENLSGKTYKEAEEVIEKKSAVILNQKITFQGDKIYELDANSVGVGIDVKLTTDSAMATFRDKAWWKNILDQVKVIKEAYQLKPSLIWSEELLAKRIGEIEADSSFTKVKAAEYVWENSAIKIVPSVSGYKLDKESIKSQTEEILGSDRAVKLNIIPVEPEFNTQMATESIKKAEEVASTNIQLKNELFDFKLAGSELVSWLQIYSNSSETYHLEADREKYLQFFEKIAKSVDREVKNPVLKIEGETVTEFVPPEDGRKTDANETMAKILAELNSNLKPKSSVTIELVVRTTKPEDFENNQYGIREFLARGISDFSGSIPSRIHNIRLAASRINGALIKPEAEFSFNSRLGDISAATGYQQAYVIENGKTVLGDGGGVCQVSTTMFRAALNAGLEITVRSPHAYRVGYYEKLGFKPGLDAAIYYPSLDLKFKNNTPKYLLINAYVTGTRLIFDIYGTSDNRKVTISDPVVTNVRPAPEPRYQDDPTLPRGQVKQVDFAANGATSKYTQTVTLNNQTIINKTFTSTYRPWQAVYLVGTKDN